MLRQEVHSLGLFEEQHHPAAQQEQTDDPYKRLLRKSRMGVPSQVEGGSDNRNGREQVDE
jgi:hypothetical protein